MPYSIFKLDIIMSRWDQRIYLLTHGMSLNRKLLWGKGGNVSVFFHRMLQKHASFQNDSCDRLTCEFLSALTVVTRKLYWVHRRNRNQKTATHKQNKETLPISAMDYNKESRPGVNLETTKRADSWGGRTATKYWTRFH